MAALGLCCCVWAFSSCGEQGPLSSFWCAGFSLQWLLLSWRPGSRHMGFSSCSRWAQGLQLWALEHRVSGCGTQA